MTDTHENIEQTENKIENMEEFRANVDAAIERIRPALQMDGGDCRVVEVTSSGDVILQLVGACSHCAASTMTLKMGIEQVLKEEVPGFREVFAV